MARTLFHATPYDLDGVTDLLPPAATGREPHWDDMDASEADMVFLSDTIEAARGWGSEIAGQYGHSFRVYEVTASEAVPGAHGTYATASAHIERLVLTYDATSDEVSYVA